MLRLDIEPKEAIADWVKEGFGGHFLPGYKVIAAFDGERLLGAVVFDAFSDKDCNLHIRVEDKRCVSRRIIRAIFDYPFRQLGLERVSVQVMASNAKSIEFVQRLGFVYEGAKRMKAGSQLMFGLLLHECQWCTDPIEYEFAQMLKDAA